MNLENIGIGADIENINRFKEVDENFLNKVFTRSELDFCFSKKDAAQHLAARYSGKEAVFKALCSIGLSFPDYQEIEILNDDKGVPIVNLKNEELKNILVKISLSHCEDKASAFAIALKK